MAIDANFEHAVPLIEYSKLKYGEGSMEMAFVDTFAETSDLMAAWPMRPAGPGGKYKFWRTSELPSVQNRAYNEPGNVSFGRLTKFEEGVYLMDEYVRVDRAIIDEVGSQARARQEHLKAVAMSQHFSQTLVHGSNSTEPREADGFQARCTRVGVDLFHNSAASGGAALSLTNLDIAINAVNRPTHILMDYSFRPYWWQAARSPTLTNNAIQMGQGTPTDLGRTVVTYQGLPILFGYEPDDSDPLLPFTEVASGGGAAVTSSIYILSLGDQHMFGIEGVPLTVRDEGIIPGVPVYSTHMKWDWGVVQEHPRAMARLDSFTQATIVA